MRRLASPSTAHPDASQTLNVYSAVGGGALVIDGGLFAGLRRRPS
jgi:hypothetical protein